MRPPAAWPRDDLGQQVSDPARCLQRQQHEVCHASLATVSAIAVDEELVDAQGRIDALLEHGSQPTLAGENLDPPTFLQDLRALANILYDRPRPRETRDVPGEAARRYSTTRRCSRASYHKCSLSPSFPIRARSLTRCAS